MNPLLLEAAEKVQDETGISAPLISFFEVTWNAKHSSNYKTRVHVYTWETHHFLPFRMCGHVVITEKQTGTKQQTRSFAVSMGVSEAAKAQLAKLLPEEMKPKPLKP